MHIEMLAARHSTKGFGRDEFIKHSRGGPAFSDIASLHAPPKKTKRLAKAAEDRPQDGCDWPLVLKLVRAEVDDDVSSPPSRASTSPTADETRSNVTPLSDSDFRPNPDADQDRDPDLEPKDGPYGVNSEDGVDEEDSIRPVDDDCLVSVTDPPVWKGEEEETPPPSAVVPVLAALPSLQDSDDGMSELNSPARSPPCEGYGPNYEEVKTCAGRGIDDQWEGHFVPDSNNPPGPRFSPALDFSDLKDCTIDPKDNSKLRGSVSAHRLSCMLADAEGVCRLGPIHREALKLYVASKFCIDDSVTGPLQVAYKIFSEWTGDPSRFGSALTVIAEAVMREQFSNIEGKDNRDGSCNWKYDCEKYDHDYVQMSTMDHLLDVAEFLHFSGDVTTPSYVTLCQAILEGHPAIRSVYQSYRICLTRDIMYNCNEEKEDDDVPEGLGGTPSTHSLDYLLYALRQACRSLDPINAYQDDDSATASSFSSSRELLEWAMHVGTRNLPCHIRDEMDCLFRDGDKHLLLVCRIFLLDEDEAILEDTIMTRWKLLCQERDIVQTKAASLVQNEGDESRNSLDATASELLGSSSKANLDDVPDSLLSAAATLVRHNRISQDAAAAVIASFAVGNPVLQMIHDEFLASQDILNFLEALEDMVVEIVEDNAEMCREGGADKVVPCPADCERISENEVGADYGGRLFMESAGWVPQGYLKHEPWSPPVAHKRDEEKENTEPIGGVADAVDACLADSKPPAIKVNLKACAPWPPAAGVGVNKSKTKLFVYNLSYTMDEFRLRSAFEWYGQVTDVFLPLDHSTTPPRPCGFGFVTYANRADYNEAIQKMDQIELDGRTIRVRESHPRDEGSFGEDEGGELADAHGMKPDHPVAEVKVKVYDAFVNEQIGFFSKSQMAALRLAVANNDPLLHFTLKRYYGDRNGAQLRRALRDVVAVVTEETLVSE